MMYYIVPLPDWSRIAFIGSDVADFLHNQITINIKDCAKTFPQTVSSDTGVKFSGYCNPKGKLLSTFWLNYYSINTDTNNFDQINLFLSKNIAEEVMRRFKMYILRRKVKIEICTKQLIFGICSDNNDVADVIRELLKKQAIVLRLPDIIDENKKYQRYLVSCNTFCNLDFQYNQIVHWNYLEIISAFPRITINTYEKFTPQMLNLEHIGGLSFQKGCYPGQEVIARTQYLGTVKRRLYLGYINHRVIVEPGEVIYQKDTEQSCGIVLLSCYHPKNICTFLQIVCNIDSTHKDIYLISPNNIIQFAELPYTI